MVRRGAGDNSQSSEISTLGTRGPGALASRPDNLGALAFKSVAFGKSKTSCEQTALRQHTFLAEKPLKLHDFDWLHREP